VDQLGVFAKYWQPGEVKTRLASAIGAAAASHVYRQFIVTLLQRFGHVADHRILALWPPESRAAFAAVADDNWLCEEQSAGDLGTRMRKYFEAAFANGARRVVLIGSDSPTLPIEYVQRAFQQLEAHPVVLGPTPDGGYYLVGAANHAPPIFDGINWSTAAVWKQTTARLKDANCPFTQLPEWYDVDELDDLKRMRSELRELAEAESGWDELLAAVNDALESGGARE
jgi:rSAM/selenodomain-associated transferase 1